MNEQVRRPLPDSLMKAIRAVVENEEATRQERFEAVVLMTHGYGLWEAAKQIDPRDFAIPEGQWREIAELLSTMAAEASGLSRVNAGLGWMNVGPSAYDPASESEGVGQ